MERFFAKCEKRNFKKIPRTYSVKPLVKAGNFCIFPELAILEYFKKKGYRGLWVDAFHKKYWTNCDKKCSFDELESDCQKIVRGVEELNNGKISGCRDLIIWKGNKIKFVESKGKPCHDKIRKSQLDFKNGLMSAKFKEKDFTIIEWDFLKGNLGK